MQRRCTQSACRRMFPIGHDAPVRCPYCGAAYPRVQPDPRALRDTFGYSVRVDFTGTPGVEVWRFFPQYRTQYARFRPRQMAIYYGASCREARELCRQFRLAGIPADVITTWDAQRQHLSIFRP